MDQFNINYNLDDLLSTLPIGSIKRAQTNNIYGINHTKIIGALPINKDEQGLCFFVRPQLNMLTNNLRNYRKFYTLLTDSELSMPAVIRNTLDPRLARGYNYGGKLGTERSICPLVDEKNCFIPMLTNNITSMSGWPDLQQSVFKSKEGGYKETYTQVDGIFEHYGDFDIDCTFKNTKGDGILYMMYIWQLYASLVFTGTLMPYPDFIVENELDYNTRIYRITTDATKTKVTKIAATGIATPISVSLGQFFDYSTDKVYSDSTRDISIRFSCTGALYFDDLLIHNFNKSVVIFNPNMADRNDVRVNTMSKIPPEYRGVFRNRGYPRINPDNYDLEWWIDKIEFTNKLTQLSKYKLFNFS